MRFTKSVYKRTTRPPLVNQPKGMAMDGGPDGGGAWTGPEGGGGQTGATSAEQRLPIKDHGPCFGTNGHPRRDTDVISRLSKSTIEDLSFYVGFTMELLASRILDLVLARMIILEEIRT